VPTKQNRSTIEFMGLWELFNNPDFNSIEFDGIKNMAGSNSFSLKPNDGAFEFASWPAVPQVNPA